MKQQVSPVAIGISAVVLLCLIVFIATRVMNSGPAQSGAAAAPPPPATINGHQVPAGAPTAAFQRARDEAAGNK